MLPLTKTEVKSPNGNRVFELRINSHYYGLTVNLPAIIYAYENGSYVAIVKGNPLLTTDFKKACKFLEDNAIKPMFKY